MAKPKKFEELNKVTLEDREADINRIFNRIDLKYFSQKLYNNNSLSKLNYQSKMLALKQSIDSFKSGLLKELAEDKNDFPFKTAQRLADTLNNFFLDPNEEDKQRKKFIENFWHYSRNAKYSHRLKSLALGAGVGTLLLIVALVLIFATGGGAAIGIGVGIGIAFGVGGVGGILAGLGRFILGSNKYEKRGSAIYEALLNLNKELDLHELIKARNKYFDVRPEPKGVEAIRIENERFPERKKEREQARAAVQFQETEEWNLNPEKLIPFDESENNQRKPSVSHPSRQSVRLVNNQTQQIEEPNKREQELPRLSNRTQQTAKKPTEPVTSTGRMGEFFTSVGGGFSRAGNGVKGKFNEWFSPLMMPKENKDQTQTQENIIEPEVQTEPTSNPGVRRVVGVKK